MKQITRIEQIHYELQAIARIQDPEERSRILQDYRRELDTIGGGLKSTINGDIPGLLFDEWVRNTPGLTKAEREDYRAVRAEWKDLHKAAGDEERRLKAYRAKFDGAKADFSSWFDAPSDKAVSDIFAGSFKVQRKESRLQWKGRPVEAILFARATGISTAYLNAVFQATDGRKFQDSALKPDRRKNTDNPRPLPEIVKAVARYKKVTAVEITQEYSTALLG